MSVSNSMLIAILAILLAAGCSEPPAMGALTISSADLHAHYGRGTVTADEMYLAPRREWVHHVWQRFRRKQQTLDLFLWLRRWDCDDFARAFHAYAAETWARADYDGPADGLAVGQYYYRDPEIGPHAIIAIWSPTGPWYMEPQDGEEAPLSGDERDSAWFAGF